MSDDRNDYQSLYEAVFHRGDCANLPEDAVNEGKEEHFLPPLKPLGLGHSWKHNENLIHFNEDDYSYCINCGVRDYMGSACEPCTSNKPASCVLAQPQPAGTRILQEDWDYAAQAAKQRNSTPSLKKESSMEAELRCAWAEYHRSERELAALQQGHDACVVALENAKTGLEACGMGCPYIDNALTAAKHLIAPLDKQG